MVLYPAIEKARRVRALEYANGVRRAPLWIAYGLFDAIFVVVIAVGCSLIVQFQLWYWNGPGLIMLPILFLYGVAAVLLGYVVSHFVTGPLKSFMAMGGISLLMYAVAAISFSVSLLFILLRRCVRYHVLTGEARIGMVRAGEPRRRHQWAHVWPEPGSTHW